MKLNPFYNYTVAELEYPTRTSCVLVVQHPPDSVMDTAAESKVSHR